VSHRNEIEEPIECYYPLSVYSLTTAMKNSSNLEAPFIINVDPSYCLHCLLVVKLTAFHDAFTSPTFALFNILQRFAAMRVF